MTKKLTEAQLAEQLAISRRHLARLKRAGMPVDSLEGARQWRETNVTGGPADGADLLQLRAEVLTKRVELLQLELDERRRNLIDVGEAERIWVGAGQACRVRLEHAERTFRARHPGLPEGVYCTVGELHREVLNLLADDILRAGEEPDSKG